MGSPDFQHTNHHREWVIYRALAFSNACLASETVIDLEASYIPFCDGLSSLCCAAMKMSYVQAIGVERVGSLRKGLSHQPPISGLGTVGEQGVSRIVRRSGVRSHHDYV